MGGTESGVLIHGAGARRNISRLMKLTLEFLVIALLVKGFHGGAVYVARKVVIGAFDDRKLGRARTIEGKLCGREQRFLDGNNSVRVWQGPRKSSMTRSRYSEHHKHLPLPSSLSSGISLSI